MANNYFGFTHSGTQYTPATPAAAAYQTQSGYAVAPTAATTPAGSYSTQRGTAGYEYSTGTTAYAVPSAAPTAGTASTYDYGTYARSAQAYDTTKTYYQQPTAAATSYATTDYSGWTQASTAQKPAQTVSGVYTYASTQQQQRAPAVQKQPTLQQNTVTAAYSAQTYAQPSTNAYSSSYSTVQPNQNKFTAQAATVKKPVQSYTQPNVSYNTNTYIGQTPAVSTSYSTYSQNKATVTNNKPVTVNKNITPVGISTGAAAQATTTNFTASYDQALYNAASSMYQNNNVGATNTLQQNKPQWKNYNNNKMGTNTTTPGQPFKFNRPKQPPKPQQLHYCEVCKISCAGALTYKEHLEGSRHKKKEQALKAAESTDKAATPASRMGLRGPVFKCELCSISCTGTDAYSAHIRGLKHQKVVKLHQKLGKPIPEPDPKAAAILRAKAEAAEAAKNAAASGEKVVAAPKINFVSSGNLTTTGKSNASDAGTERSSEDIEMLEDNILPVGQEFVEEIKTDDGKLASFHCKLCDCKFNDPNAKDMHMKGKRHRLAYKKKVDPTLVVEVKPSYFQKKQKEQRERMRHEYARRREEDRHNFWADKMMEAEERMYWEERRRYEEEMEYYEWNARRRMMGPMPPPMPIGHMRAGPAGPPPKMIPPPGPVMRGPMFPETYEDRHVIAKHASILPKKEEVEILNKVVDSVEKSLKNVSDLLVDNVMKALAPKAAAPAIKQEPGSEKKEDLKTLQEKEEKRVLKGVNRVGNLAKNLLLQGERNVELIVLCAEKPTLTLLKEVVKHLPQQLKTVAEGENFTVVIKPAEAAFIVTCKKEDGDVVIKVILTSPIIREELLEKQNAEAIEKAKIAAEKAAEEAKKNAAAGGAVAATKAAPVKPAVKIEPKDKTPAKPQPKDLLNTQKCLDALASLRHAKWFQAKAEKLESCVMVIRLLRHMGSPWNLLSPWALELFVEKIISSAKCPLSPGDAFRRIMEAVSSGILLPNGPGLLDPCEKDPIDVLSSMTAQEREDVTVTGQTALRQVAFHQIHKLLEMEQLKLKKNFRGNRKRRRDTSSGEKEDGANKKDKKEEVGKEIKMETK